MCGLPSISSVFCKSLINSIIQEHEYKILFYHKTFKLFCHCVTGKRYLVGS